MKLHNTTNPSISVISALGTDEEMELFVDHLIAASEINDAKAANLSGLGGHEELPRAWFN